jgi:hypothetical protein
MTSDFDTTSDLDVLARGIGQDLAKLLWRPKSRRGPHTVTPSRAL